MVTLVYTSFAYQSLISNAMVKVESFKDGLFIYFVCYAHYILIINMWGENIFLFYFETLCEKSFEQKCCNILHAFNFKVAKSASRRRSWFRINFMGPSPILSWMCVFVLLRFIGEKEVEIKTNSKIVLFLLQFSEVE